MHIEAAGGRRWRLAAIDRARMARYGDELIVFNPLSWQTHYFNASAARVLNALLQGPRGTSELIDAMGLDADAQTQERVLSELLGDLQLKGLVGVQP